MFYLSEFCLKNMWNCSLTQYEGRFLRIGFDIVVGFEQTSSSIFDVTESILYDGVSA